ncbi:hypothetical protein [Deinococcus cellulosilyticus]|uniref:Uncharacterized protein n=1 Tax=Deinococcus cellulosilyticus (strain DSM 18568 / NBRC 106333 / KACC 11606 / 5516J-15) TaxID=1223518 RepID=A0A511N3M4_DEIC1|nr:hypothetical protein [Deinococcus cellulosilyticus]GEM47026.1 hypothetical protein DC3_26610 [Deinococcus cellulosilyticus NBRC 106333 = KACC 11606]
MHFVLLLVLSCFSMAHALNFEQLNDQGLKIQRGTIRTVSSTEVQADYRVSFPGTPSQNITVRALALQKNHQIQKLQVLKLQNLPSSQGEKVFNAVLRMASLCLNFGPSAASMDHMMQAAQNSNLNFSKTYGSVKVAYQIQQGKLLSLSYQRLKTQPSSCTL